MAGYPKPKQFRPENPKKYIGDITKIVSRSSWETKMFRWCDNNPSVIRWNSEDIVIPYFSSADEKMRRYHIDVYAAIKMADGTIKQYLIEIKPNSQTKKPIMRGRKKKETYLKECYTFQVNSDKWEHAKSWAKQNGMEFIIMDEFDLGLKKKK